MPVGLRLPGSRAHTRYAADSLTRATASAGHERARGRDAGAAHQAVREVVGGVDAPPGARVRVRRKLYPVRDQVKHVVVRSSRPAASCRPRACPPRRSGLPPLEAQGGCALAIAAQDPLAACMASSARRPEQRHAQGYRLARSLHVPETHTTNRWQRMHTFFRLADGRPTRRSAHRSVAEPSSSRPRRMSLNRRSDTSAGRSRQGLGSRASLHRIHARRLSNHPVWQVCMRIRMRKLLLQ